MAIQTVGVIGTGVIGASWTALFLAHGLRVIVSDPAVGAKEKLQEQIRAMWPSLERLGLKSNASPDNFEFVGASLKGHYDKVDFVQENAPEQVDLKTALFAEIDAATRPEVIIASSSSGLPSSKFISGCKNVSRILIGHPFNPPHLMPLVEVVPHSQTSPEAVATAIDFYKTLERYPIHIRKETPGHVANRLQVALGTEANSLVARGIVSAKDLDACITNSLGIRWSLTGPFISNAMGGGGGIEGYKHILEHLGPASKVWLEDMQANAYTGKPEEVKELITQVGEELEGQDVKGMEAERDRLLVEILRLKAAK